MDSFIIKDGKKLRRGFTTGSCAAAAAKSAALMLLTGLRLESIYLLTPGGIGLDLPIKDIIMADDHVSCGIVKDSGDDPDMTNGITIYARVEKTGLKDLSIEIDGGQGIGRVTKPGLDQPVGNAAINSVPRRMITEELRAVCEDCGYAGGLKVIISTPEGEEIAKKTFNPRLGIKGGISILGTTGIVEPMSDAAVVETIRAELKMRAAAGNKTLLFTPGNYGADFIGNVLHIDPKIAVITSNFIGDAFSIAHEMQFESVLLVGHIGKLVKLAGGMFNTHSRWGDCRAEIFAAHAACCGAASETVKAITESTMTDDMLSILESVGLRESVMNSIMDKISLQLENRDHGSMRTGVITFSKVSGILGETENSREILEEIREEYRG